MVIPLAVGLMVAGLLICWLHTSVKQPTFATIVYWTGIVITVIGFVMLAAQAILWLNAHLRGIVA